ncbi:Coq5p [Balamuthia mandrillaris]
MKKTALGARTGLCFRPLHRFTSYTTGLKSHPLSLIQRCNATTARFYSSSSSFSSPPSDEPHHTTTHFGFKTVKEEEKASLVGEVFHRVANSYDLMNDLMSGGIHRLWKDQFVSTLNPLPGARLLDVAGGTGDIAFRCIEAIKRSPLYRPTFSSPSSSAAAAAAATKKTSSSVMVCDINPSMLNVGKERGLARGYTAHSDPSITWVVGDAESLPVASDTMDGYTIAFGIRNCTRLDKVLREAHRVLRRGGRFLCLEFSHLESEWLQRAYDAYSFQVIPVMGHVVAGDYDSYQYLVESIRRFPRQEEFSRMISEAGFSMVTHTNLSGGIACIHSGWKL